MLQKIGITELRRHLKDHIANIAKSCNVYQVGEPSGVLIMSQAALAKLQRRHYVNIWARNQYTKLKLDSYMTITSGKKTKDLPLDMILALSEFFGLIKELTDILSRPGAKENALKWDVSEYINAAVEKKPLDSHNKFDGTYAVATKLFCHEQFGEMHSHTLNAFFYHLNELVAEEMERMEKRAKKVRNPEEKPTLATILDPDDYCCFYPRGLSDEQLEYVLEIVGILTGWATDLIEYQPLNPDSDRHPEYIFLKFKRIMDWYETYVGELPNTLGYDLDSEMFTNMVNRKTIC